MRKMGNNIRGILSKCLLCPRQCGVDRNKEERGFCGAGSKAEVYAAHLHFGEEPPISGDKGSGTVFFNHCNMRCVYCQNYKFSQIGHGKEIDTAELAAIMLSLKKQGAHNINLVTPTHYAVQIKEAVLEARSKGLGIPIVYNSGGYEDIKTLRMMEDIVDIYLVDMRYGDNISAAKYSSSPDYVAINRSAIMEMHRQVGGLDITTDGIAKRGVIIRHLVLPNKKSGSDDVFRFISERLGRETYISFMSQYYPVYRAFDYQDIARGINEREYNEALGILHKYGLKNGWVQHYMGGKVDKGFAGTGIVYDV